MAIGKGILFKLFIEFFNLCTTSLYLTFQRIMPPMAGQFISLIKDSSIVSVISIQELCFQGIELMTSTLHTIEIWIVVTIMYLALTLPCSLLVERLENRLNLSLR